MTEENTTYKKDKDGMMRWLTGIAATIIVSILMGIYGLIKDIHDFVITAKIKIEYLEKKDVEHDSRINRLDHAVFVKPKEISIEDDK
jgi:hypothetical protein